MNIATPFNEHQPACGMEYKVVIAKKLDGREGINPQVTALIKEGWRPLGPAQMVQRENGRFLINQTMVKDED